ncbi:phosphotransferase system, HPr-related protein [Pseudomonas sp. UL073]|uniref:Phosphotransferase system, HPr-related protein n=1 Tax=Zestomonas insulae TaxID=2809017 RepID=A0ABS2IBJ0_9GAMM|nr:phosphotransferase system, HPr-related protein [Pseudomonas insulae]MBM7059272.1 phosphotransferase system, HPr-related protein [Pseudomonas insulae]
MSSEHRERTGKGSDDSDERTGALEPLDFSDELDERERRASGPAESGETNLRGAETLGAGQYEDNVSEDDLSPETLIPDDGARSPRERGQDFPADFDLSIVDEEEIGAGHGLDEAELGRVKPLDGKRWSGRPRGQH